MAKVITAGTTTWTMQENVNLFDGRDVYIKGSGLPHDDGDIISCKLSTYPNNTISDILLTAPVVGGVVYFYLPTRLGFDANLGWKVTITGYFEDEEILFEYGEQKNNDFVPAFFYPKSLFSPEKRGKLFNRNKLSEQVNETIWHLADVGISISQDVKELLEGDLDEGDFINVCPQLINSTKPLKFIPVEPDMVHLTWKRSDTGSVNNFWFHVKKTNFGKEKIKSVKKQGADGVHDRHLYMPVIEHELTSGEHEAFILKELQTIGSAVWIKRYEWLAEEGYPVEIDIVNVDYSPLTQKMGSIELILKENYAKPQNLLL